MAKKQDRYLKKIGDTWYFRKKIDGKIVKRSLGTSDKAVARDLRDTHLNNLARYNQLEAPVEKNDRVTFGQVAKKWASIHKHEVKYSTWRDYVCSMNKYTLPAFKDRPINDITYTEILEFRKNLDVGPKRANNILVPMKSVFNMADIDGILEQNVMKKINRLSEEEPDIRPLTYEQIQMVLDAVVPWYRPYVAVAFFTGMRAGELNALKWTDYQENMVNGPHLFIRKTFVYGIDGKPKTKKSKRFVTCLPEVIDALNTQKKLTGNRQHIFLTKDGNRMTPDHFRKEVWIPVFKKAGIEYVPPMQTRHTFATMMLSAGEDVGWVQNMLGHSSLQMIFQRYYSWIPQKTRSDGQAFRKYIAGDNLPDDGVEGEENPENKIKRWSNIVPLDEFRHKKSRSKTG